MSQEVTDLPYREIPDYPDSYTAGNVVGRMIDGLGFRYYWATEGLTEKDLAYRPTPDARSTLETLDHIYGLTSTIINAVLAQPNQPREEKEMSFEELRRETLLSLEQASKIAKAGEPNEMAGYKSIFQRGENTSEYPFWNMINGPIADAIYHTGQVVSFRRTSGNPKDPRVSLFQGKLRE